MENNVPEPWNCFPARKKQASAQYAELPQWPLKLSKLPTLSPFFHKAHLLIAADCTAFTYDQFRSKAARGRVVTIGCPDTEGDVILDKLRAIITLNDILSIRLVRMDAACCQSWVSKIIDLVVHSGKNIPLQITTVFAEGEDVCEA